MRRFLVLLGVGIVVCAMQVRPAFAQYKGLEGQRIFNGRCVACHGKDGSGAPLPSELAKLTPEAILSALNTGSMSVINKDLTEDQKRYVAEFLGGRAPDVGATGDAKAMPNRCSSNPPVKDPSAGPAWNGWGVDVVNSHFQPAKDAGLSADQVPKLKLKWAFGFPNGISAYGQPTVASGRMFVGSDNSFVYSLDAKTGCVYWSFRAQAGVRTAIVIGTMNRAESEKYAAYFGDMKGNVYAVNAHTGELLWKTLVDKHLLAHITAAPTLYGGRLYVPVSSWEEATTWAEQYPCCTFRGNVVALDANTGQQLWKTYVTPEPLQPTRKNSLGTQLWGPAGASVWTSPTIDVKRQALYVGTGDAYTEPASKGSDAIVAMDLKTGNVLWSFQATPNDAWGSGCAQRAAAGTPSENCPKIIGPDLDFDASPILRTMPDGHQLLFAPEKQAVVWVLDPDREGALLWKTDLTDRLRGAGRARGTLQFGWAADERIGYLPMTGTSGTEFSGGIAAFDLKSGERLWYTPFLPPDPSKTDYRGQRAAISLIPGVVFGGGYDGVLRAVSTVDGRILWQYNTLRDFETVNGVAAKGGSMGSAGPTVVGGMVFVGSGYYYSSTGGRPGVPGNVLLAFGLD